MRKKMGGLAWVLSMALVLTTTPGFAFGTSETQTTSQVMPIPETTAGLSHWNIEGDIQAHSVAGSASPWLGMAAAYRVFESLNLGLRGFLPLSQTVDKATYALQTYARYRVFHGSDTDLFLEPEFSENFFDLIPFGSYGLSVGVLNHLSKSLSVGLMGGIEVAQVVVDSVGVENETGLVVYPKIGVLTNFNF
jgi:hypothetical protein